MVDSNKPEERVHNATNPAASPPGPVGPVADLQAVYQEYGGMVLRAARRVTGSLQDAEDVLQTVFLRLARREGGYPLSDGPAGYLHRAAINAALDLVRSKHSARSTPLENVEARLATGAEADPARAQQGSELRDQIRGILAAMSPKSAEIFTLRYFEGYGNHEIARMLGTSRNTVNVIVHRARQKVKEELQALLGDES